MRKPVRRKLPKSGTAINFAPNVRQKLEQRQNPPCAFCRRNDDCPEKYGEKKTYDNGITLHYYCLVS
ncbi:hypothetical protein scyTo_0020313 [Scyliorhinus torazame]|uniref:PHD-type domain-containing protein n=1 Tax=Scyliorhinus torazame TaxID=75743 RepID=A0A401PPK1_SCYTO|nr:hypothetical protein [Scyliorhinus torazame]